MDKAKRPVMKPTVSVGDKRKLELIQLETRYKSTYRIVKETETETLVRLAIKPSDPDFPYEIDALQLQLSIPKDYPTNHCSVQVLNSDIPKGFAINLEKGYLVHADPNINPTHQTLVRQMNWLDRNMESLLQQPPAATVRFVANSRNATTQEHVKEFTDSTSKPITSQSLQKPLNEAGSSSSSSTVNYQAPNNVYSSPIIINIPSSSKPVEQPKPVVRTKPVEQPIVNSQPTREFTNAEMKAAEKKRKFEISQLQSRFCDSFKTSKTATKGSMISLVVSINDTDFTHEQFIGGKDLYIKYNVPALYPLEPCSIEIDNRQLDKTRATWVANGFNQHVEQGDSTLFENLNWLNRNLEHLLSTPPVVKTVEQEETAEIAAAQHKESKPPVKKDRQLSVTAPVFTPQPKKKSLFDDENDIKRNKVIIVNDPSLIIEQAEEEEVEVELTEPNHTDESHGEEEESENSNMLTGVSQPIVRKGTEIRLMNPKLDNVSLFRCTSLHIMVKCGRCKETVEVQNIEPDQEDGKQKSKERWMSCPTCTSELGIRFLGELVHQGAMSIGLLQLSGCKAYDILPSAYIGTCGSCMADMPNTIRLSPHDPPRTISCFSCHVKMTCGLGEYTFIKIGSEGGEKLKADEKQVLKLKKKKKREDNLTIGEPLPDRGTCSHYRKSNRWFRFSCCSKLYACDICHDSHEDHHSEMAKRHVCGMCSREQTIIGGKACACGHEFEKAPQKGAFWEGGKGVRNVLTMSRKDPHKRKGLGKTQSKKQERVGSAGKERHQKEPATHEQ
ncbi:hypothetical protein MFLAVUS_004372 [Mucor flavus]|uniref:CHY-type domain-containing protein n=1 Tax=Mucor flavus TaxID=439312 RepID=A0ABP9YVQ6_9FUNG